MSACGETENFLLVNFKDYFLENQEENPKSPTPFGSLKSADWNSTVCLIVRDNAKAGEHVWFWVWSLARAKKAILNFKRSCIRIPHFITFSVIYSLLEFYGK